MKSPKMLEVLAKADKAVEQGNFRKAERYLDQYIQLEREALASVAWVDIAIKSGG